MIDDFDSCRGSADFETDVCIIGAGPAGITVARQLLNAGLDICLLESGGRRFEDPVQNLAAGSSVGFPYYDLIDSRLRLFGGTTAIWGGRVAQLDDIDFEKRSWVPNSGWPFAKEELRPYYQQAQTVLELEQVDDNRMPGFTSPLDPETLRVAFWQFDEKFDRFTLSRCTDLVNSSRVRILLHATVTRLQDNEDGTAIESVEFANLNGGRGTLKARTFVLASGGVEIPRLLLASKTAAHRDGIGNKHGLVGRFFMEHPRARGARIILEDSRKLFDLLPRFVRADGQRYGMLFRPGEAFQKKEGILNTCLTLAVRRHSGQKQIAYKQLYNTMRRELSPKGIPLSLWKMSRRASVFIRDKIGPSMDNNLAQKHGYGLYAVIRAEQAPSPESRVELSDRKDALGVPLPALDWRIGAIDKHSAKMSIQALDRELRRLELGHVEPAAWLGNDQVPWKVDPLISNHHIAGYHQMGTTRMSASPRTGVVDGDGRVHGLKNLYIAGSSVFPTGGWANPTLTIIALAIRLADKLRAAGDKARAPVKKKAPQTAKLRS